MSLIDKLTGRAKKAAGDLTGDGSLRREGIAIYLRQRGSPESKPVGAMHEETEVSG